MNVKIKLILIPFLLLCGTDVLYAGEMDNLKKNYKREILKDEVSEYLEPLKRFSEDAVVGDQVIADLTRYVQPTEAQLDKLLSSLSADGSWNDINYKDNKRSGWGPKAHADRVLVLCKAYYGKTSPLFRSKKVMDSIHHALNFWFNKNFVADNWWYNQIGIPKTLGSAFVLLEGDLSRAEKQSAVTIMLKSKLGMTGQNMVWLAGNVFVRAMLEDDMELARQARDIIVSQIVVGEGEGIQRDHSFHQHGPQQQFGNYGAAFIMDTSFWARVFYGTSFALDQSKLDVISDLINGGFGRVMWKGYMDVNGLGRQFFKGAQAYKGTSVIVSASAMASADRSNEKRYINLISENFSPFPAAVIQEIYHFWLSDLTICRRPGWMGSVKMSSPRVIGSESVNGDNLKGYYLADGAFYTYVDGDEYSDIFPVWDWRKIPGVTTYEDETPLKVLSIAGYHNGSSFAGNVTDGKMGMTSMQLNRDGLKSLKSWIFTPDYVFCIGSGINSESAGIVTTSIEQRVKKSDLLYFDKNWAKIGNVDFTGKADVRLFHDKTGYIISGPAQLMARDEERVGSWGEIMQSYAKDKTERKEVVSLWIDHGKAPQNASYQYFVLPFSGLEKTSSFPTASVEVLSATSEQQVIYVPGERMVLISAVGPINVRLPFNVDLKSKTPGLFMVKYVGVDNVPQIIYADPTRALNNLDYEVNGSRSSMRLYN